MNITLEILAEKLHGKLWTKGELKRIYLDEGYNTKKMSTKTYIQLSPSGMFDVKCFIDCPSQDYNWIKSQQEQIIDSVENQIRRIEKIENLVSELQGKSPYEQSKICFAKYNSLPESSLKDQIFEMYEYYDKLHNELK